MACSICGFSSLGWVYILVGLPAISSYARFFYGIYCFIAQHKLWPIICISVQCNLQYACMEAVVATSRCYFCCCRYYCPYRPVTIAVGSTATAVPLVRPVKLPIITSRTFSALVGPLHCVQPTGAIFSSN